MKVGITGHRTPRIRGKEKDIECWISGQLKNLKACYKDITLITGMADGVDQIAALAQLNQELVWNVIFLININYIRISNILLIMQLR